MKKMLDDPKKKIFMLYPRFIQMILDERYPTIVKGPNYINLKPMGPRYFGNTCRNKRAKHHNFEARYVLEKHGSFAENVQGAPVAPAPPIIPIARVPPLINVQIAEEHDIQHMQQVHQATDDEDEVLFGGDGNTRSVSTTEVQKTTADVTADVTKESAQKKQRTDTAPDDTLYGLATTPESTAINDPQPDPPTTDASKKTNLEDPDLYDFNFDFETTPSQLGSSSGGVHFEARSSSGAHTTEHDEAAFHYASKKRQVFESDIDSDEEEYVKRLKRRVVILEHDGGLKSAQIVSL
ncbi:hypothetical protein Hanom_Chr07g00630971 [Helianthus anomalus]